MNLVREFARIHVHKSYFSVFSFNESQIILSDYLSRFKFNPFFPFCLSVFIIGISLRDEIATDGVHYGTLPFSAPQSNQALWTLKSSIPLMASRLEHCSLFYQMLTSIRTKL